MNPFWRAYFSIGWLHHQLETYVVHLIWMFFSLDSLTPIWIFSRYNGTTTWIQKWRLAQELPKMKSGKKHPKKKKVWRRFHVFKWKHHEKNKQEVVEVEVPPPIEYHSVRSCDQFEGLTLSWIVFCWVIFDPFYYHFAPHKTTLSKWLGFVCLRRCLILIDHGSHHHFEQNHLG